MWWQRHVEQFMESLFAYHSKYLGHGKPFPMELFMKEHRGNLQWQQPDFHARAATRGTDCDESVLPELTNVMQV